MRVVIELLGFEMYLRIGKSDPILEQDADAIAPTHNDAPIQLVAESAGFIGVSDRFDPWETEDKR